MPYKQKSNNIMQQLVILTGAGISAESGLSTFRDTDGLWQQYDVMELASIQGYRRNRERVLEFYNARRSNLLTVRPNHAHDLLAELERDYQVTIITQNVDDLHERAGSTHVLHLHGELTKVTSSMNPNDPKCVVERPLDQAIAIGDKAADGSQLRPFIVFFGENVPNMSLAAQIVQQADIFVVIGTSLVVYPAATLLRHVPKGTPCFLIDPGTFDDTMVRGFEHIQTTAVAGIDLLKEKLRQLRS